MIGQLSTIGLAFVFALVLGFGGGYWLDLRLGTKPVLSLLGFVLGLAAGVLNVVRTMRVATAPEPDGGRSRGAGAGAASGTATGSGAGAAGDREQSRP